MPTDLLWSFLQAIVMSIAVMLVHTYYGYNAPAARSASASRSVRRCAPR